MEVSDPCKVPAKRKNRGVDVLPHLCRRTHAECDGYVELGGALQRYEFVAALGGLFVESRFEPLLAQYITFGPKRGIVFHLGLDHRVENDSDLVRGCGRTGGRT